MVKALMTFLLTWQLPKWLAVVVTLTLWIRIRNCNESFAFSRVSQTSGVNRPLLRRLLLLVKRCR
jgi:hypothetical protein